MTGQIARIVLIVAVCVVVFITLSRGHFESHLWTGSSTYIVTLERSPVWSPPPVPDYAVFRAEFEDLPVSMPASFAISRMHKWSWTLLDWAVFMLVLGMLTAVCYLPFRKRGRDVVLHVASWIGIGLAAGAALCIIVWMFIGGWGPPEPLFFASIGCVGGVVAAAVAWRHDAPRAGHVPG